jgi:hypothetical protein
VCGRDELSNGRCVIAIANCVRVVNSQCVECVQGYTLQNFSQCVLLTNNCMTYSPSTGLCTTCFPRFYLQNSTCLQNPPNCLTFTNETCLQCVQGFTLRNSSCIFKQRRLHGRLPNPRLPRLMPHLPTRLHPLQLPLPRSLLLAFQSVRPLPAMPLAIHFT